MFYKYLKGQLNSGFDKSINRNASYQMHAEAYFTLGVFSPMFRLFLRCMVSIDDATHSVTVTVKGKSRKPLHLFYALTFGVGSNLDPLAGVSLLKKTTRLSCAKVAN